MREIKFRGKRLDNGEFVEGYFQIVRDCTGKYYWINDFLGNIHDVDPETVGQYIGFKDISQSEIYEGDILEFEDIGEEGYEYIEGYDFTNRAKVVYRNARFELEAIRESDSAVFEDMRNCHDDFVGIFKISKVIGNIHDNPELLEV